MKKYLAIAALATVFGTQAFAQSYDPDLGTGNIGPAPYTAAQDNVGFNAFAQAPHATHAPQARANDLVRDSRGAVVGEDPDINIRSQLMRDNRDTEW